MGMRKRWYQIAALFVLGTVLFSVIQFGVLPQRAARQQAVAAAQNDALTHDISAALPYQNLYLGDVSNTHGLILLSVFSRSLAAAVGWSLSVSDQLRRLQQL